MWYLGLLGVAASALAGADEPANREDRYTARVLELPAGKWLVAAVGLGIFRHRSLQPLARDDQGFQATAQALGKVLRQDYGDTLLGLVAGGLLAYGLYCFVEARYREV